MVTKVQTSGMVKIRYTDRTYEKKEAKQHDELLLPCCHAHWGEAPPAGWSNVAVIPGLASRGAASDAAAASTASLGASSAVNGASSSRPPSRAKGEERPGVPGESLSRREAQLVVRQAEEAEVLKAKHASSKRQGAREPSPSPGPSVQASPLAASSPMHRPSVALPGALHLDLEVEGAAAEQPCSSGRTATSAGSGGRGPGSGARRGDDGAADLRKQRKARSKAAEAAEAGVEGGEGGDAAAAAASTVDDGASSPTDDIPLFDRLKQRAPFAAPVASHSNEGGPPPESSEQPAAAGPSLAPGNVLLSERLRQQRALRHQEGGMGPRGVKSLAELYHRGGSSDRAEEDGGAGEAGGAGGEGEADGSDESLITPLTIQRQPPKAVPGPDAGSKPKEKARSTARADAANLWGVPASRQPLRKSEVIGAVQALRPGSAPGGPQRAPAPPPASCCSCPRPRHCGLQGAAPTAARRGAARPLRQTRKGGSNQAGTISAGTEGLRPRQPAALE